MAKERMRNDDARGGDVLVNDSIATGNPDIDRDPGDEDGASRIAEEMRGRSSEGAAPPEGEKGDDVC